MRTEKIIYKPNGRPHGIEVYEDGKLKSWTPYGIFVDFPNGQRRYGAITLDEIPTGATVLGRALAREAENDAETTATGE